MKFFGLEIKRAEKSLSMVPQPVGLWHRITEPFTGAFQRNIEEKRSDLLCYPTLYACVSRLNQDAGKLPFLLKSKDQNGIWQTVENPAYSPVLRKQNHYQTHQQFRECWLLSKLLHGNTYVLKQRDARGVVVKLYVLDPCRVKPLVSESGDVFYELWTDHLNLLTEGIDSANLTVPAREIMHDRWNCFYHHLIGVPPLCAAYWPAVKNLRILRSASEFFGNGAQPGGILTAPGTIKDADAKRLKDYWDSNFTGANAGKVAVVGDGVKYEAMSQNAADSQLVEQMRYSDEQICQPFGIPPFKIGIGSIPAGLKIDDINQMYYADALQTHIEAMENLLDEGLGISLPMGVECDLWPLLRMDESKQADVAQKLRHIETPDESRMRFNRPPLEGGDTVYLQMQDLPLAQAMLNVSPSKAAEPVAAPAQPEPPDDEMRQLQADNFMLKAVQAARLEAMQ